MSYTRIVLLIVYCFIVGSSRTKAQPLYQLCQPDIVNYSKQMYGAYNQNWGAVQDSYSGFMYFANSQGLMEFDGNRWTVYPLPDKQIVRSVACDGKGRIYSGGLGEIGYWEASASGHLSYHSISALITNDRFKKEEIWKISVEGESVWFQSFSLVYVYQSSHVQTLQPPGNILFLEKIHGHQFVGVLDQGLNELINGQFTPIKGSEFLSKTEVPVLLPFSKKGTLIGTNNEGLFLYDASGFRPFVSEASRFLKAYQLNKGIRLNDSTYAFGSILNGLIITDQQGNILQHLNQVKGLQNNTVLALTTDNTGNLWVGLDKGIDLIVLSSPVRHYKDANGDLGAVYDAAIHDNQLYLGTNHGVFYRPLTFTQPADFTLVPGTQGQVWDLEVIDGQLLCGHNHGTFAIQGGTARLISPVAGGWVMKQLKKQPTILLQGTYSGLSVYRKDAGGQWAFSHTLANFMEPVRDWDEDEEGNIWVTHALSGIYRVKLSDRAEIITDKTSFGVAQGLPRAAVSSLLLINQQVVAVTDSAVMAFNPRTLRFIKNASLERQLGPNVRKVMEGYQKKRLLVKKDGGVLCWQNGKLLPELYLERFSWVDGYEQIVLAGNGTYLACQENGFALIPEAAFFQDRQTCTSARIRRVEAPNVPAIEIRQVNNTETKPPTFGPRENDLTFAFSTPLYGTHLQYSYWLEGFSQEWSPYTTQFQKEYTNLPPGSYVFQVRNKGCQQTANYAFTIAPPWYNTAWARVLYGVAVLLVMVLIISLHNHRLKVQQERVRRRLDKKIKKQEEVHQQLIIQHRNEKLEQDILNKSVELANSTANLIQKNRILIQIKEEVSQVKTDLGNNLPDKHYHKLVRLIDNNLSPHQDSTLFETNFNKVHEDFFKKLLEQHPKLMPSDLRLAAYLRMNLSSKEIAQLLNITIRGVELKRYRLRKRLNLPNDQNLIEFMMKF
jgi:DNA-binding CsgD family transcriptional regulator